MKRLAHLNFSTALQHTKPDVFSAGAELWDGTTKQRNGKIQNRWEKHTSHLPQTALSEAFLLAKVRRDINLTPLV